MLYKPDSVSARWQHLKQALPRFPQTSTELTTIIWVLGLWQWGNLLKATSDSVDLIILALTFGPALILFWSKPEYGVIAFMFFASGFLAPNFVDIRLPIGGGLEMRDLLLLALFGLMFFQRLSRKNLTIPWWPVGGLLVFFLAMVFFSAWYALRVERVAANWVLSDVRILLFYLTFFITAWAIASRQALYTAVIGCFVVADITAAIVIIQQYLGPHRLLLESMSDTSWQIWAQQGATRVVPPGIVFVYFMMLMSVGLIAIYRTSTRQFLFWTAHSVFLGVSLLLTFTRSSWVASGIALLLMTISLYPIYRLYLPRMLVFGMATLLFLGGTLGYFLQGDEIKIPVVSGLVSRFSSIFEPGDTLETNSLQWRLFELQEASKAIRQSPFIGVGLGNSYRNLTVFQGEAQGLWTDGDISSRRIDRFTRYAHSSYLAITVKMGIPAMLMFLAFCGLSIFKSWRLYRVLPNGMAKGIVLPVAAGMVGLLQWSTFHAQLILAGSTPVIGFVIGLLAAIDHIQAQHPPTVTDLRQEI